MKAIEGFPLLEQHEVPREVEVDDIETAVLLYFERLHARAEELSFPFHREFADFVAGFSGATFPVDLGLSAAVFPHRIHRRGSPTYIPGNVKSKEAARAKYEYLPGGRSSWPPRAAKLRDLVRGQVLFDDFYDLAVFLAAMRARYRLLSVRNRFLDFDQAQPAYFRNVNACISYPDPEGSFLIVEIQLHLRTLYELAKEAENGEEAVRSEELRQLASLRFD